MLMNKNDDDDDRENINEITNELTRFFEGTTLCRNLSEIELECMLHVIGCQ